MHARRVDCAAVAIARAVYQVKDSRDISYSLMTQLCSRSPPNSNGYRVGKWSILDYNGRHDAVKIALHNDWEGHDFMSMHTFTSITATEAAVSGDWHLMGRACHGEVMPFGFEQASSEIGLRGCTASHPLVETGRPGTFTIQASQFQEQPLTI